MPVFLQSSRQTRSSSSIFPYLIGIAFAIAVCGLLANLWHLQTLTNAAQYDENFFFSHSTHHDSPWEDEGVTSRIKQQKDRDELIRIQDHIWRQILQQAASHFETCNQHHHSSSNNATITTRLPKFGFINNLNQQLMSKLIESSSLKQKQIDTICQVPPSTSCKEDTYTLIIPFSIPNTNLAKAPSTQTKLRQLFLTSLSWLSNPSTTNILIVFIINDQSNNSNNYNNSTTDDEELNLFLHHDAKYGQRLLAWDKDKHHPVRLKLCRRSEFGSCLERAVSTPGLVWYGSSNHNNNPPDSHAIEAGWELWKRHSHALIVPSNHDGYQVSVSSYSTTTTTTESRIANSNSTTTERQKSSSPVWSLQPVCSSSSSLSSHEQQQQQNVVVTTTTRNSNKNMQQQKQQTNNDNTNRQQQQANNDNWNIINLRSSGMIMFHRHHLCWFQTLWNTLFDDNHNIILTEDEFWFVTSFLLTFFVTTTFDGNDAIQFVPSRIITTTATTTNNDNKKKYTNNKDNTNTTTNDILKNDDKTTAAVLSLSTSGNNSTIALSHLTRRRLLSTFQQEEDFITSLIGFMGSLPVSTNENCRFCDTKAIFISQLPWMTTPCLSG